MSQKIIEYPSLGTPPAGSIRFNTDSNKMEIYNGEAWWNIDATSPELETGGTRGLFGGGEPTTDTIDFINIGTTGNATDFGNLSQSRQLPTGFSDRVRACFAGGRTPSIVDTIDFVTMASTGNATDFGNLTVSRMVAGGASSSTRGLTIAGMTPSGQNTVDYVTIQSTGNAVDFGDTNDTGGTIACQSPTRAVASVGDSNHSTEYFTISTLGNASDFGDMHGRGGACSNAVRGLFGGEHSGTTNTIEYITIATLGDGINFGDLSAAAEENGSTSSSTRGVWAGGMRPAPSVVNTIDYVQIMTLGNAVDYGDLTRTSSGVAGASNGHGGLG
tara:strand:+ start:85 stop:1074 length:990 start_codon:yes stop_codon:yes gene_type:complete